MLVSVFLCDVFVLVFFDVSVFFVVCVCFAMCVFFLRCLVIGISPHYLLFFLLSVSVPCACDCALCRVVSVLISVTLMTEHVCVLAQDASEKCAQQESSSRQTGQFCIRYPTW